MWRWRWVDGRMGFGLVYLQYTAVVLMIQWGAVVFMVVVSFVSFV